MDILGVAKWIDSIEEHGVKLHNKRLEQKNVILGAGNSVPQDKNVEFEKPKTASILSFSTTNGPSFAFQLDVLDLRYRFLLHAYMVLMAFGIHPKLPASAQLFYLFIYVISQRHCH